VPCRLGLRVLRRTYRQDYETLFHGVILSKHHHHHIGQNDKNLISALLQFTCSIIEHPYPTSHGYSGPQGPLMKSGFDLVYAMTRKFKKEFEGKRIIATEELM
jgi:hypothetical protein